MAKTSMIARARKLQRKQLSAFAAGKKLEKSTSVFNVCQLCGRTRGYNRRFQMCRICFRQRARKGEIMGVKKSSW